MRKRDTATQDMFAMIPQPAPRSAGSLACRVEIAHTMSAALNGQDRYEVAATMSRLLGRDISKHMLDAYTAESREDHIPPLDTAIAFDMATSDFKLLNLCASKLGARVSVGADALYVELVKLERQRDQSAERVKYLKKLIEDLPK